MTVRGVVSRARSLHFDLQVQPRRPDALPGTQALGYLGRLVHEGADGAKSAGLHELSRKTWVSGFSGKEKSMHIVGLTCLVFVTALLPSVAGAQDRLTQLTREEAIRIALERNATLRAKQLELQSTQANETTAALWPNPTATFLAEQFGSQSQPQYTFSMGQPIETGGKRARRIESARAATRVTGYELEDVRRQIIFQTKKAFNDALVAQATTMLARENLATLEELERIQQLRVEHGDISQLELTRIQIQR